MMRATQLAARLAAAFALLACEAPDPAPAVRAPVVATARVVAVDLEERIGASGELVARRQATLTAEVSGRVTAVRHIEGEPVQAGDVVLEIDRERRLLELDAAQARVAKALASLERQQRETERMRTLHESNVASVSRLEVAETDLKLAEASAAAERAQLGVAQRALADASVKAPFDGKLGRRHANVGQFVQVGTPLFEIVSLGPIEVVFHVSEIDSARASVGQKVDVTVAPYPDRIFEAVVISVSPTIDSDTRTLRVKALLPNGDGSLRPGLFAHTDLGVAVRRGVTFVPEEAVLQRAEGAVIFTLDEGSHVQRRIVTIGAFHEGSVEIVEGVAPGEIVVTRGQTGLVDGSLVRVSSGPVGARDAGLASTGVLASDAL
jgi:membrane fusion protein (multidrug efflux system)